MTNSEMEENKMKKNIIIIIAAVIIAAGLGTGSFFGIRSARNPENVKNDVTTTEQNATPQNTDDENDTVKYESTHKQPLKTIILYRLIFSPNLP